MIDAVEQGDDDGLNYSTSGTCLSPLRTQPIPLPTSKRPFSLRARPGAPASTPLSWQALKEIDDPRDLDWSNVPKRLVEAHADPWQDMDAAAVCITRELEAQVGIKPSDKR